MRDCNDRRGFMNGIAGETRVSVLTRSGRVPATCTAMAPPSELPTRWTGPRPPSSIQRTTRTAASAIRYRRPGSLNPKPGRSIASASN